MVHGRGADRVRRARPHERRHDRRHEGPRHRRRRRVPGDRRVPRVPHPADGAGRVRRPEGRREGAWPRPPTPRPSPRTAARAARKRRSSSSASSTSPRAQLGIDPVEIRKRNFIPPDAFPHATVTGANYDIGEYAKALDEACRIAGYDELRAEQAARRERGDSKLLGIGVSAYVEITARGLFQEYGKVEITADGGVDVTVGTSSHGQGHEHRVRDDRATSCSASRWSRCGSSSPTPRSCRAAQGTMGSRSLQIAGSARARREQRGAREGEAARRAPARGQRRRHRAARRRPRRRRRARRTRCRGRSSRSPPTDAEQAPGRLGGPSSRTSSTSTRARPRTRSARTSRSSRSTPRPAGSSCCASSRSTTAGASSTRCSSRGQQHGGIAQGVAQALYEQVVYDDDGNPLTGNLMDYAMPSAAELPSFEASNTETPTPLNPLGAKGIGESGTIGSTPAVQNAVVDAVSHLGVSHLDMPLTAERVWRAIQEARGHCLTRADDSTELLATACAHAEQYRRDRRALLRRPPRRGVRDARRTDERRR